MATNILLGIGNPLNGDDGVGIYVAEQFKKEGWISISCGTALENFTEFIRKTRPSCLVLLSDSAETIILIGIQPERAVMGGEISPSVREGAHRLVHTLSSGGIARIPFLESK